VGDFLQRQILVSVSIFMMICALGATAPAEPVPVRHQEGTLHGFLELRAEDGKVLASGDSIQVARGDQITTRTIFHFKDGSIDDDTTVLSQRRNFQLISDHHIQRGPFFPHPMDVSIDSRKRQVTVRSTGKDGKEETETEHFDMPPDLANGMIPLIIENIPPDAPGVTVSMLVATPKPRVVKLEISPHGEEPFSVVGSSRQGIRYEIKIDLGGVAGVVAPLIGKAPPNIQIWIVGGPAPMFIREQGPIYPDGPILTIELASPLWPDSAQQGE
jgi:hypothetical protein